MRLQRRPPSQLPTDTAPARSGQFQSNCYRRCSGGPRAPLELSPNCVWADHGAAPGDAAGRLVWRGRAPTCLGATKTALRAGPQHSHLPRGASFEPGLCPSTRRPRLGSPSLGPGPGVCSPGQCPSPRGARQRSRGLHRRLRPSVSRSRRPNRVPGTAERGPAAQSALTWKCSAIFPGGGAGRRSREPEGREGKRAPRKPQPPAGSLRRSLARSSPGPRGPRVRSTGRGGAWRAGRGDGDGARWAGPRGAGPGGQESQLSSAHVSTAVTSGES